MIARKEKMKYYFFVEGEKKEDLDVIRQLVHNSKKFNDAPSGMSASFILEGSNPDYEIRQLKDKLTRRNRQIRELKKRIESLIASYETHCPEAKAESIAIKLAKEYINR